MDATISDTENRELIVRFRKGDQRAFNKLIESNQGLVIDIARQYSQDPDFLNDLIQEGNLGFIRAVQKFNLNGKTKLSTYATIWVKSSIETYISKSVYSFKVSQATRKLAFKVAKKYKRLISQEVPGSMAIEMISRDLNLEKSAVAKLASLQNACASMNERRYSGGSDDSNVEIQDTLKSGVSVEGSVSAEALQVGIEECVSKLPEKQRDAVSLFYGLGRYPELSSFSDIARHMSISREYARLLYNGGMKKLNEEKRELRSVAA